MSKIDLRQILEGLGEFDTKKHPELIDQAEQRIRELMEEVIGERLSLSNYYNLETDVYEVNGTIGDTWDDDFEAGSQQTIDEQRKRLDEMFKGGEV